MSNIDKRALREAAEKAGADEWLAFIDTKSKTYSVHTPGDNRCGDVVKWAGFDGQKLAAAKAKFIAAANPATVLVLLDELEAKDKRIAQMEAREVTLPETRITVAESRRRNMNWRELGAYNEGADVAVEKIVKVLSGVGINIAAAAGKGE